MEANFAGIDGSRKMCAVLPRNRSRKRSLILPRGTFRPPLDPPDEGVPPVDPDPGEAGAIRRKAAITRRETSLSRLDYPSTGVVRPRNPCFARHSPKGVGGTPALPARCAALRRSREGRFRSPLGTPHRLEGVPPSRLPDPGSSPRCRGKGARPSGRCDTRLSRGAYLVSLPSGHPGSSAPDP